MLHIRKFLCLLIVALLLVQPVFAETEGTGQDAAISAADLISAVYEVAQIPANWSPFSPPTAEQQWLLHKTTAPVYQLTAEGSWNPILARELPEDVTASYAGSYGIPSDARGGYAYRILLNSDARWDDGLMITADDYIFSIGKLLEDEENRQNWLFLANAAAALTGTKSSGDEIVSLRDAALSDVSEALDAGFTDFYVDTSRFWGLDHGWMPITDRSRLQDFAMPDGMDERFVSPAYLYSRYLAAGQESSRFQDEFIGISTTSDEMTLEDLGIAAAGPFELILILQQPLAPSALMQKLENLYLLRQTCWGKDFATSAETYCGYGPYRITYTDPEQIILEPNENWWGEPVSDAYDRIICRDSGKE